MEEKKDFPKIILFYFYYSLYLFYTILVKKKALCKTHSTILLLKIEINKI